MVMVVVMMVMRMHMGACVWMFTIKNRFTGIDLSDSFSPIITAMSKTCERTVIHRVDVLRVSNPRHGIIIPIQVARFNGRFKSSKNL